MIFYQSFIRRRQLGQQKTFCYFPNHQKPKAVIEFVQIIPWKKRKKQKENWNKNGQKEKFRFVNKLNLIQFWYSVRIQYKYLLILSDQERLARIEWRLKIVVWW